VPRFIVWYSTPSWKRSGNVVCLSNHIFSEPQILHCYTLYLCAILSLLQQNRLSRYCYRSCTLPAVVSVLRTSVHSVAESADSATSASCVSGCTTSLTSVLDFCNHTEHKHIVGELHSALWLTTRLRRPKDKRPLSLAILILLVFGIRYRLSDYLVQWCCQWHISNTGVTPSSSSPFICSVTQQYTPSPIHVQIHCSEGQGSSTFPFPISSSTTCTEASYKNECQRISQTTLLWKK